MWSAPHFSGRLLFYVFFFYPFQGQAPLKPHYQDEPVFPSLLPPNVGWGGQLGNYTVEVTNRFKELDLIDRVPEKLWTEVCDIVQEAGIKTIPKEKKCKKAKWLSEEALQIAVDRRDVKGKGEKERYTHLNAEFQGIARRDKKAFLSYQCKEIEENNRMGKTRDLIKKIRDTKGTFHAVMGTIKDRNGMDLTEAENIKKR